MGTGPAFDETTEPCSTSAPALPEESFLQHVPFASVSTATMGDTTTSKKKSNKKKSNSKSKSKSTNNATSSSSPSSADASALTSKKKAKRSALPKTVKEIQAERLAARRAAAAARDAVVDEPTTASLFKRLSAPYRKIKDAINYSDVLPVIGNNRISYSRLLQLLNDKQIKRMYLLGDARFAVVEVPAEGWNSDLQDPDALKYSRETAPEYVEFNTKENPEWRMEKLRFYCELPGNVFEDDIFMRLVKGNMMEHRLADDRVRAPARLQADQCTLELQVVDPSQNFVWVSEYGPQLLPIVGLIALRSLVQGGEVLMSKLGWGKKDKRVEQAEAVGKHTAQEFNVEEKTDALTKLKDATTNSPVPDKKKKRVGVTFKDVAGIDPVKGELEEILRMILGDESFRAAGVKAPRGILLEGPPGTGKTLLAKAMAGEKGLPFYAANGAEFVEMFQGVAAARIRSLFKSARKNADKGAIIFIDEIDAIGKARGGAIMDPGAQEREQGLLQLLVEMDGFNNNDKILIIAATNRSDVLDDALLRPGRFDRLIYMGRPGTENREAILHVHARGKPVGDPVTNAREEETKQEDTLKQDASDRMTPGPNASKGTLLAAVAQLTPGFSGAELANLMNEAAIVMVRQKKDFIDYDALVAALEKIRLGLSGRALVPSAAKERLARLLAAKAVAFAVCPVTPPIEQISILPRGSTVSRINYMPLDAGLTGGEWHRLAYADTRGFSPALRAAQVVKPAPPIGSFAFMRAALIPLLAGRAAEHVFYGPDGATLSTSDDCAAAAQVAQYLVADSGMDPATLDSPIRLSAISDGTSTPDATTRATGELMEGRVMALTNAAFADAEALVKTFRPAIERITTALLSNESETVKGGELLELLQETCAEEIAALRAAPPSTVDDAARGEAFDRTRGLLLNAWGGEAPGWQDVRMRTGGKTLPEVVGLDIEAQERLAAVRKFAVEMDAPFPPAPGMSEEATADSYGTSEYAERLHPAQELKL